MTKKYFQTVSLGFVTFLVVLVAIGARLVFSEENDRKADALSLIQSASDKDREQGRVSILTDRAKIVLALIKMIKSPRIDDGDAWTDPSTTTNIAIQCIAAYRAVEAVPALVPLLDLPPGTELSDADAIFRVCPAARALIAIGPPAIPAVIDVLKVTGDPKKMAASQARIVLFEIEGADEGTRLIKNSLLAEKDPTKRAALEANLPREKESKTYLSKSIGELVDGAIDDIGSPEPKKFMEDVKIFYDVHRGDLLALGLRSSLGLPFADYDSFVEVMRLIEKLPEGPRRDSIVVGLTDERVKHVFTRIERQGEQEASRHIVVLKLTELVHAVLRENNIKMDFDGTKPDSIQQAVKLLRQKENAEKKGT